MDTLLKLGDHELLEYDEATGAVDGVELYMESLKKLHEGFGKDIEMVIHGS